MLIEECMHRSIPFPIIFFKCCGIPPILIEFSVSEPRDFSEDIEDVLKDNPKNNNL